jgi:hypothetical protein
MSNDFHGDDADGADGERSPDDRSPAAAGVDRRRFTISGTIVVAGQQLGAPSANDNGLDAD